MALQKLAPGSAYGRAHCCQLNKHIAAVTPVANHALDRFQVPNAFGKPVEYGLGFIFAVGVPIMGMSVAFVFVLMVVCMVLVVVAASFADKSSPP